MAKKYVVVNGGFIECGVSSGIVGIFADKKRADDVADACYGKVFELPEPEKINPDYNKINEVIK